MLNSPRSACEKLTLLCKSLALPSEMELGFRDLGFRGLGFRDLGFRALGFRDLRKNEDRHASFAPTCTYQSQRSDPKTCT